MSASDGVEQPQGGHEDWGDREGRQPMTRTRRTKRKIEPANAADSQPSGVPAHLNSSRVFALPAAGQALSEMLATLGHEFSTPLAVIEGYTATLLAHGKRLEPEEQEAFLQMIQQAGQRLEKLTRQLLEIAQLEAGLIAFDHSLVDIVALAHQALLQAERQVPESRREVVTFALHCRDEQRKPIEGPLFVSGDVQRLQQVLALLLENAVLYSPAGGSIDIVIQPATQAEGFGEPGQAGKTADEAAFWEICVCDFGIGIPAEQLERIFEPFYRVDTRLTREQYGLGLGLTACKYVVALHHGRIWAESCPDGGSAFHVWLPSAGPYTVALT